MPRRRISTPGVTPISRIRRLTSSDAGHAHDAARLADRKLGRDARHAVFLGATITRSDSSSRKQSVLPSTRTMHGEPQRIISSRAAAQAQFFEPADLLGRADDLPDLGDLAGRSAVSGIE